MKQVLKKAPAALPFFLLGLSALFGGCVNVPETKTASAGPYATFESYTNPHVIIRQADRLFDEKDFPAAREEYERFIELHPSHERAPYAQYRIARSFRQAAVSVHHDITPMERTLQSLEKLVRKYPRSDYAAAAINGIAECRNWLAEARFIRGRFYYDRGNYRAAEGRFESVLQAYPETAIAPEAQRYLGFSRSKETESRSSSDHASFYDRRMPPPAPGFLPEAP